MCYKDDISQMIFKPFEVPKYKIRLNSENLQPYLYIAQGIDARSDKYL